MRTESGMNNMNMESTNEKARARNMRRRILACICAFAIAVLQCAVIVTMGTEQSHAADVLVDIDVTYDGGNGYMATKPNCTISGGSGEKTLTVDGDGAPEEITIKGKKIDEVLADAQAKGSVNSIHINGSSVRGSDFVITSVSKEGYDELIGKLYSGQKYNKLVESGSVDAISVIKGKMPVEFSSGPTPSSESPKVGDKVNIKYKLKIDDFLPNSENYNESEVTRLKWSTTSSSITMPSNTETRGVEGVLKGVTIKKAGSATVNVSSVDYSFISSTSVTIKGEDKPDIKNATVSLTKNPVKGKKYSNADLKKMIKLTLNGKTIDGKYWGVTGQSTKNNKMTINIGLTDAGKKLYKGSTSKTVDLTPKPEPEPPSGKSLNNASISKTGKLYKGKNYKNSEVKKKISVSVNGQTIDKKYWDVVNYSTNGYSMTVQIKGKNGYEGGTTSSVYLSSQSTSTHRTSARTYRTYTPRTVRPGSTSSTGTTVPNVTYAPDRTITVKEVFLGQQIMDEPQEEPTPADMMEEGWDDMSEDESNEWDDAEDITLDFGPMAGSAAVAVGACGAGVVGRIRKFKLDTATKAVEQVTNTKGKE